MERQLATVVNKALLGEPEHAVLQIKETLKCIEFSQIKSVSENGELRNVSLVDAVLDQPEILHILNAMGHEVEVTFDENDNTTIYF